MRIDIAATVDRNPIGLLQVRVVVLCGLVALLDGFDLQTMAIVTPRIAAEWALPFPEFSRALSASLAGILLGALIGGLLGDHYGRRRSILIAFLWMGLMSLLTATATSVMHLAVFRLLTGVGLGACLPNIIALTTEYIPERRRTIAVALMFCGVPLGGGLGSYLATDLVAAYGWRSVFITGGILPLAIEVILWFALPESIRFLAMRKERKGQVIRTLQGIDTAYQASPADEFVVPERTANSTSVQQLFADGRSTSTIILWAVFFCNLFEFYFLLSWLPSFLTQAGWPRDAVGFGTSLLQLGGIVGALPFALLTDRFSVERVLLPVYLFGAVAVAAVGNLHQSVAITQLTIALTGAAVVGSQFCLNALAASIYPTDARSTGVGWALGIGRFGAVVSPLIGGAFIAAHWPQERIFALLSVPALLCAVGVTLLRHARRSIKAQ